MRRRGPVRLCCAVLVGAALVAPACKRDEGSSPETAAPAPPPPPPVFPLSGTPVTDPATATRPALVIKVDDDNEHARPQEGLRDADLVYEEKVEGSLSRFAAVYHSLQPPAVGPVRSGRTTDIAIVSSLNHPLYAFSGANGRVLPQLRAAPLVDVGYDAAPEAYERRRDRQAPYNLWTFPEKLRAKTPPGAGPPPPAFTFGDAPLAGATPAATVAYDFGPGGTRAGFTWDPAAKGWARTQNGTPHVDIAGNPLVPANVIVQLVPYVDTGDTDVAGAPVPEAQLIGKGEAFVLTRGSVLKTTWQRPDPSRPTEFGPPGAPVALTPGQTWVALVPEGSAVTVT